MYLFSMDNPFFRFVGKLVDLVWLNIITLICCVPIVTVGASLSAMYHVLIKMALKEEGTITKPFFKAFKDNFKNATKVWIPSFAILMIMISNAYLIKQGVLNPYPRLLIVAGVSIGIIICVVFSLLNYYLPLITRYDNEFKQYIKNALLMAAAYFPRTLCMLVIWLFPLALMTISNYFFWLWFMYGLAFPGYFNAMLLGSLFLKTESVNNN